VVTLKGKRNNERLLKAKERRRKSKKNGGRFKWKKEK